MSTPIIIVQMNERRLYDYMPILYDYVPILYNYAPNLHEYMPTAYVPIV